MHRVQFQLLLLTITTICNKRHSSPILRAPPTIPIGYIVSYIPCCSYNTYGLDHFFCIVMLHALFPLCSLSLPFLFICLILHIVYVVWLYVCHMRRLLYSPQQSGSLNLRLTCSMYSTAFISSHYTWRTDALERIIVEYNKYSYYTFFSLSLSAVYGAYVYSVSAFNLFSSFLNAPLLYARFQSYSRSSLFYSASYTYQYILVIIGPAKPNSFTLS